MTITETKEQAEVAANNAHVAVERAEWEKALQSAKNLIGWLEEINAEAEVVTEQGWTRGQMRATFDRVADRRDWKAEIWTIVPRLTEEDRAMIREAVGFFTATLPIFRELDDEKTEVRATGYRNGPAGP